MGQGSSIIAELRKSPSVGDDRFYTESEVRGSVALEAIVFNNILGLVSADFSEIEHELYLIH
jgi:hypothetical protein